MNNLKQIGVALHNHHDANGSFPAAFSTDDVGRPDNSWRTRMLPFLEQKVLYDQLDFKEPWDGPHNGPLCESDIS